MILLSTFWATMKWIIIIAGVAMLAGGIYVLSDPISGCLFGTSNAIMGILIGGAITIFMLIIPYWYIIKWILISVAGLALLIFLLSKLSHFIEEEEAREKEMEDKIRKEKQKEQERIDNERWRQLERKARLNDFVKIPIDEGAINRVDDEHFVIGQLEKINNLGTISNSIKEKVSKGEALTAEDKSALKQNTFDLADANLEMFFHISIWHQCQLLKIPYKPYSDSLDQANKTKDYLVLRTDDDELDILKQIPTHQIVELEKLKRKEVGNNLKKYLNKLKSLSNEDTSGLLGQSVDKVSNVTQRMNETFVQLKNDMKNVKRWCGSVNEMLNIARIEAYRNQYLGNEVVNLIKHLREGDSDSIEMSTINIEQLNFHVDSFSLDNFSISYDNVINNACDIFNEFTGSGINLGRKGTAAVAVGAAALAAYGERNQKLENNAKQQKAYIDTAKDLVPKVERTIAETKDAIDIIKMIVEANDLFMAAYIPLRNDLFRDKKAPKEIPDLMNKVDLLKVATKEYNKISMKQIKH